MKIDIIKTGFQFAVSLKPLINSDKQAQTKLTDEEVFKTIKHGRKNQRGEQAMDPFATELSDKEITEIVAFVRTLAK